MTVAAVRKDPHRLTLTAEAEFAASVERIWPLWADMPTSTIRVGIEKVAPGRTRMSIESVFPNTAALEPALAMDTDAGLSQVVGQIDALLAEATVQRSIQRRAIVTTLTDPQWKDTTLLSGDVAAAIGELKATAGGELQVHGSGSPVRWLLDKQLVDEITLLVCPVIVGQGTRLFPDSDPDIALDLVDSRAYPKGITLQVYRPNGRPQYAT